MGLALNRRVTQAQNRIREAAAAGVNRMYVAYSGGKDSEAVLRLTRSVYPCVTVIHNGHKGEKVENTEGVLFVKEPKAENVPKFLSTVNVTSQIDGTRKYEDKTVIFDGVEIHRRDMPNGYTTNGVWGLEVFFPIWDWTDEDVFEYLRETDAPKVGNVKVSYEGEGPLLGIKTLFCHYPGHLDLDDVIESTDLSLSVGAIFINADSITTSLMDWVSRQILPITIEIKEEDIQCPVLDHTLDNVDFEHLQWFVVCREYTEVPLFAGFVKIRVLEPRALEACLEISNQFAEDGHTVLLMPEYRSSDIGLQMIEALTRLNPGVRFMPPVQHLLGIP